MASKNLANPFLLPSSGRSFDFQISKADIGDGATALFYAMMTCCDLNCTEMATRIYEDNHIRFGSFSLPFLNWFGVNWDWHR